MEKEEYELWVATNCALDRIACALESLANCVRHDDHDRAYVAVKEPPEL